MAIFEILRPGERVYMAGSSGTPALLVDEVLASPGLDITTSFVPGVNDFTGKTIGAGTVLTGFFMQPALAALQRAGSYRHLPQSYAGIVKFLGEAAPFDTCIVQITPPDAQGYCSLGPAAEFTPPVLRRAGRVIGVVNADLPHIPDAPRLRLADCAQVIQATTPITTYDPGAPDATADRIARHVATLVPDGATLQLGLGKIPAAIYGRLTGHRELKFHTGMLSDGVIELDAGGALDKNWLHKTTVILGTRRLYDWAAGRRDIMVAGCDVTHDPTRLAALDGFIAINSALEVDLFGQCNLELASGQAVSGVGGAPDFARAARLGRNGISIVALPAQFGSGKTSRIKPGLGENALASLPRHDVDIVVTEEGIADLRGKSVHERAEALIEIAAPTARPQLGAGWRDIQARL